MPEKPVSKYLGLLPLACLGSLFTALFIYNGLVTCLELISISLTQPSYVVDFSVYRINPNAIDRTIISTKTIKNCFSVYDKQRYN